ncbi:glycosyl transferase, group 1 [Thermogladius calderae 1633]|uniref:Glycosyl transferase, group 1 n=1 Tax=Thermogladius calderae (strain DSM 22663 / VKM B-2946 / 1633) TaxID=1184251 RepID=I3TFI1_THEC1|nr:glycosyltransferase [Thermogladius calderae]AFK51519.1 glycosyl transferase, group 1 [Thermogladius calderae 1633]
MRAWILTFESKTTRKVGGLAEVPPELARGLNERGVEAVLVTPSHGLTPEGEVLLEYKVDGEVYKVFSSDIAGLRHYIVSGGLFNSSDVYGGDLYAKALVFTRVVKALYEKSLDEGAWPDVLHANDWHSGLSIVAVNSLSLEKGVKTRLVYHVHLLSRSRARLEDLESLASGKRVRGKHGVRDLRFYYEASQGFTDKLVPLVSDATVTVSDDYARTVEKWVGLNHGLRVLTVPNASSWTPEFVQKHVKELAGDRGVADRALARRAVFKELCSGSVSELSDEAYRTLKALGVEAASDTWHQCFEEDGNLVLATGRVSRQKGFDLLLNALEKVLVRNPSVRVLLMVIPVPGSESILEFMVRRLRLFDKNLKIVFGHVEKRVFVPAHYAASVFVAPSIYEPFGLVALEAMASGTPVLASDTGGFKTTVLDIRVHGVRGTGVLFENGSVEQLASYLADLTLFMAAGDSKAQPTRVSKKIVDPAIRRLLEEEPRAPSIIRRSCVHRSVDFSWARSVSRLLEVYGAV